MDRDHAAREERRIGTETGDQRRRGTARQADRQIPRAVGKAARGDEPGIGALAFSQRQQGPNGIRKIIRLRVDLIEQDQQAGVCHHAMFAQGIVVTGDAAGDTRRGKVEGNAGDPFRTASYQEVDRLPRAAAVILDDRTAGPVVRHPVDAHRRQLALGDDLGQGSDLGRFRVEVGAGDDDQPIDAAIEQRVDVPHLEPPAHPARRKHHRRVVLGEDLVDAAQHLGHVDFMDIGKDQTDRSGLAAIQRLGEIVRPKSDLFRVLDDALGRFRVDPMLLRLPAKHERNS